ncbi:MAG: CNP1-like family protein [Thiomonas sp.]
MRTARPRLRVATLGLIVTLLAAPYGTRSAGAQSVDDAGWFGTKTRETESPVVFPAAPSELLHVHITAGGALRFYVDRASISVQPGQIVRYTLVARVPGGPSNVTYEGIDCAQRQWKLYAVWNDASKTWSAVTTSQWQRIAGDGAQRIHSTLFDDDLCKDGAVHGTAAQIAQRIQQGLRAIPY